MGTIVYRTIILYALILFVMRVMGKRQLGELQPFELVITLIIANLAQTPITNTGIPLLYGILPILSLFLIHEISAFLALKFKWASNFLCGSPTIVIDKGIIQEKMLKKMRYTIIDMLEQLRVQGISNVSDVEFAILETNGELSVMKKSSKQNLTPEDMNLKPSPTEYIATVIIDGVIDKQSLQKKERSRDWLLSMLKQQKIDLAGVLLAQLGDSDMQLQLKAPCACSRKIKVSK